MTLKKRRGFSLVELSIVLVIIALIVGAGITLGSNAMHASEQVTTQTRLKTVQEALEHFAKVNGYLPCPSNPALTPADAAFGQEQRNASTGSPPVSTCNTGAGILLAGTLPTQAYIGIVPVRTLGLPDVYAADAWLNKFTYAVSAPHVDPERYYSSAPTDDPTLTITYGDRFGVNYQISTTRFGTPGAGATYVVVSHGKDGRGAIRLTDTAVVTVCDSGADQDNDVENCNNDLIFYDTAFNDGTTAAQHFDDFVVWGSNALDRPSTLSTDTLTRKNVAIANLPNECKNSCEAWCAPCTDGNIPHEPSLTNTPNFTNTTLCGKVVTSSSPCKATCIWSGDIKNSTDGTDGHVRCP